MANKGDHCVRLCQAILADCLAFYPECASDWARDNARLDHLYRTRGLQVFTLDLPALDKPLLRGLETGLLTFHGEPLSGSSGKSIEPRLFSALWKKVFSSGCLREDVDPVALRFLRQLLCCFKKLKESTTHERLYKAVHEYYEIDSQLPAPSLSWGEPLGMDHSGLCDLTDLVPTRLPLFDGGTGELDPRSARTYGLLDTIQHVADIVVASLPQDLSQIRGRHGPGAVSEALEGGYKYIFPSWSPKLEALYPYDMYGAASVTRVIDEGTPKGSDAPSKLIAVPKTAKTPRLIASEPVAYQWMQQGLREVLYDLEGRHPLLGSVIHYRDQTVNQKRAYSASIDGSLATVDLSSASDRVSLYIVERIFRGSLPWLNALNATRTQWIRNSIDKKSPAYHRLRKFASMGSALTFPIESIVFACAAIGVFLYVRGIRPSYDAVKTVNRRGQVQVYGDDIVIPVDCVEALTEALSSMYLKVNSDKTFWTGKFRESCGAEYWNGHSVVPVYLRSPVSDSDPESIVSRIETANNLHVEGLWRAAEYLISTLPESVTKKLPIMQVDSGVFGLRSFVGSELSHLRVRENADLQRTEYSCLVLKSKVRRSPVDCHGALLQYFTEEPDPELLWESGVSSRPQISLRPGWVPYLQ